MRGMACYGGFLSGLRHRSEAYDFAISYLRNHVAMICTVCNLWQQTDAAGVVRHTVVLTNSHEGVQTELP